METFGQAMSDKINVGRHTCWKLRNILGIFNWFKKRFGSVLEYQAEANHFEAVAKLGWPPRLRKR